MSGSSPNWLRAMLVAFALVAGWGGFQLVLADQRGVGMERLACLDANRAALTEAAAKAAEGEAAPALAALGRLADCPAVPVWPWALLLGGAAGFAVALGLREIAERLARLEAQGVAPREVPVGAPIPPPARRGEPTAAATKSPGPPTNAPREATPLAEDDPRVRLVTDEMRAQGLNITPEVARHVAALRTPRAEG
jgi:hypothetical protein